MCFKKKAILMVHGFVGGIYDYGNFNNELTLKRQFDVFTFTLPGHEKTIVADVKYSEWIKESEKQIEFLINNGYKKIYVIGHSMGGVIATHLAAKYQQVKKLVLVAPAFRYFYFKDAKVDLLGLNETLKNMPEILKQMGTNKVLERIAKTPIPTMLEFTKLVSTYQNDLDKVTCPTLIIHGTEDMVVPKESTDIAHERIKSTSNTLINIKDVTHDCFTQKRKDEVKELITNFLLHHPHNKNEIIDI